MSRSDSPPLAVGLDLGSTEIKAGLLGAGGELLALRSVAAPPLHGTGPIREGDAAVYGDRARRLLLELSAALPGGTPLGIATQRSTFLVWERRSGAPRTPMISWQDRRAEAWCAEHGDAAAGITARTGLPLSPHYVGPKLAALQAADPTLRRELRDGSLLWGTLESYLIWRWSAARIHETDPSVAARTLMFDLALGDWSAPLLDLYGVPRELLPRVESTWGRATELDMGLRVTASVGDQAAGALAALGDPTRETLINLGTGAFVLVPADGWADRPAGYLAGPLSRSPDGTTRYAREGTINGSGPAVDGQGRSPVELLRDDPTPLAWCIPDAAGLGSPFWRADVGLTWSAGADGLDAADRRRVVLEGLVFRLTQILDELEPPGDRRRLLLGGGMARERFIAAALATLNARPVEVLEQPEGGLLGALRLAASELAAPAAVPTRPVLPSVSGAYLRPKFERWKAWLERRLSA